MAAGRVRMMCGEVEPYRSSDWQKNGEEWRHHIYWRGVVKENHAIWQPTFVFVACVMDDNSRVQNRYPVHLFCTSLLLFEKLIAPYSGVLVTLSMMVVA
mmetsp:Transcript_3524/g.8989  ORF Transcript_3524/g.8989 Transcript_3524/m.8989 type:complete len:99 (+) Transcript_3524:922-1218(+)